MENINSKLEQDLKDNLENLIIKFENYLDDLTIIVAKENLLQVAENLLTKPALKFEQLIDLTAVDYLEQIEEKKRNSARFEVVYHFLSLTYGTRIRVKCLLSLDDLQISSLTSLWKAADWYERECYDMYGIIFTGHPNLKRLLLYQEFEGYPLRKDYPIEKEQPLVELREVEERHDYSISRKL